MIRASSNPGDIVLDPFCGCATTLVAAHLADRRWVGIDQHPEAKRQVVQQLEKFTSDLWSNKVNIETEAPKRDRLILSKQDRIKITAALEKLQKDICPVCKQIMHPGDRDIDHRIPLKHGGEDNIRNYALLHKSCNRSKGATIDGRIIPPAPYMPDIPVKLKSGNSINRSKKDRLKRAMLAKGMSESDIQDVLE